MIDGEFEGSSQTLAEFVIESHKKIRSGKLKLKKYRKTIKQILFELAATIRWLHHDVERCHLNIKPENILIDNGEIKLLTSEFTEITQNELASPDVCKNEYNDSRTYDMYSFGLVVYFCFIGQNPYDKIDETMGSGYWAISNGKLKHFLGMKNLLKLINPKILSLLNGLLNINEEARLNAQSVIQHKLFKSLYSQFDGQISNEQTHIKRENLLKSFEESTNQFVTFADICTRD